jgi:SAM-dependent methyltransferase
MNKNVIEDPEFGYLRLNPIPSQEEVDEFYSKEFYDSNAKYFNNSGLLLQMEQSEFFNSRWQSIFENCSAHHKNDLKGKSVFDIGFGFAQALIYLKNKGLLVSGLEPSIEGYNYAVEKGIEAFHTGIENLSCVEGKKFDIVLLLNVLEHLRSPVETLKNISDQLLNENGILVIDVPNDFNTFQKVANTEFGLNEWWVVSPNHINYFSCSSLIKVLKDCGYKIFDYHSSFPLDMFLLFGDQYIGNPDLGRACHNKRVNFEHLMIKHGESDKLKAFYKSLADIDLGRTITIYAIKQ